MSQQPRANLFFNALISALLVGARVSPLDQIVATPAALGFFDTYNNRITLYRVSLEVNFARTVGEPGYLLSHLFY